MEEKRLILARLGLSKRDPKTSFFELRQNHFACERLNLNLSLKFKKLQQRLPIKGLSLDSILGDVLIKYHGIDKCGVSCSCRESIIKG